MFFNDGPFFVGENRLQASSFIGSKTGRSKEVAVAERIVIARALRKICVVLKSPTY